MPCGGRIEIVIENEFLQTIQKVESSYCHYLDMLNPI